MTIHVALIPLPNDQFGGQETTGDRGKPELDFDFLNQLQSENQSRLGSLQSKRDRQQQDLSTILQDVNVTVKDTRKRKRDSDLLYTSQANELAVRSDEIRQKAMQAAADPFNELKALFGDTPSMAEWAARHNAVQNELSTVKRRFTSNVAGYNFELDQAVDNIQYAQTKLQMTKGQIADITTASQAMIAVISTRSAMFTQQLDTMLEPELRAELKDPQGQIPADLVRRRLLILDLAKAELADARSKAGKSRLDIAAKLFDVFTKYPELIPTSVLEKAIATGVPQLIPVLGERVDAQQAGIIKTQQLDRMQLDAKLMSAMFENQASADQAFEQIATVLNNIAGPGASVFAYDVNGNIKGFNPDQIPAGMRQDVATMMNLRNRSQAIQQTLADSNFSAKQNEEIRFFQIELNQQAHTLRNKIVDSAKEIARDKVEGKHAKISAAHFAEFANVVSTPGAKALLIESAAGVIKGAESVLLTAHGAGWGEGLIQVNTKYNEEVETAGALFDKEGGVDVSKLKAFNVSGIEATDLAFQTAVGQVDSKGRNLAQIAILTPMYEIGLNFAIRELMNSHAAEPETIVLLKSTILGTIALDHSITRLTGKDGQILDPSNVLFAAIALKEKALIAAGTLPKTSNLTHELQSLLLGDWIGDPNERKSIYDSPELKALTVPTTQEGASLNLLLFQNRASFIFKTGLQNIVRNAPLEELGLSTDIAEKQTEIEQFILDKTPTTKLGSKQQELKRLTDEAKKLRAQGAGGAYSAIMQQIFTSQE